MALQRAWKNRVLYVGGAGVVTVWSITAYWALVAYRYLNTPWVL